MENLKKCRFCHSPNTKYFFTSFNTHGRTVINNNEKFVLRKCLDCECVFVSDVTINSKYYSRYYKSDYYLDDETNKLLGTLWSLIYKALFRKKEKYILSYFNGKKEKISVLDVGCGIGGFLADLDPRIFEKNGIEINSQGAELCRKKGINVYDKPIEDIDFGEKKFDVITLWHVVEHLENPSNTLEKAYQILKDDGVLVFQVPNNESLGFKYGKKYWFHLDSPRHLVIPNKKTIQSACERFGFKIIKTRNEFYDYPLDLFWSVRKSPVKFLVYPFYPLFKLLSHDHLTFICKKYGSIR